MSVFGLTRRHFLGWLSALAAAGTSRPLRAAASVPPAEDQGTPPLPQELLAALGAAILPAELGQSGLDRALRGFATWIAGYRENAELLHPYGSAELETSPASPAGRWRQQLIALDTASRAVHQRPFVSLGIGERQVMVRQALEGVRLTGMPDPLRAPHVAVALLSHFYSSPDATDLCYQAEIRKNQCRPLVNSSGEPVPLRRGRGT